MLLENSAKQDNAIIDVSDVNKLLQKSEIEVNTSDNIMDENSSDLLNKAATKE